MLDELSLGLHEYLLGCTRLIKQLGGKNEIHMKLPDNKFRWGEPGDVSGLPQSQDESEHRAVMEACNLYGIRLPYKLPGRAIRYGFTKVF